jgi:dolichyldiphosphatase
MNCGLKPFSLTFVEYSACDILGFPLALISLTPIFVMVVLTTLIIVDRHRKTSIKLLIGLILNETVNKIMKRLIAQPRPVSDLHTNGYGMPSAHAQFAAFTFIYLFKTKIQYLVGLWTVLVAVSRVHLQYHTQLQVVIGIVVGSVLSTGYSRILAAISQ